MDCRDVTGFESPKCTRWNCDVKNNKELKKVQTENSNFLKLYQKYQTTKAQTENSYFLQLYQKYQTTAILEKTFYNLGNNLENDLGNRVKMDFPYKF